MWYATKRSAQSAADAAALAGALEVARGSSEATVETKALADAERNGYLAASGATIAIRITSYNVCYTKLLRYGEQSTQCTGNQDCL